MSAQNNSLNKIDFQYKKCSILELQDFRPILVTTTKSYIVVADYSGNVGLFQKNVHENDISKSTVVEKFEQFMGDTKIDNLIGFNGDDYFFVVMKGVAHLIKIITEENNIEFEQVSEFTYSNGSMIITNSKEPELKDQFLVISNTFFGKKPVKKFKIDLKANKKIVDIQLSSKALLEIFPDIVDWGNNYIVYTAFKKSKIYWFNLQNLKSIILDSEIISNIHYIGEKFAIDYGDNVSFMQNGTSIYIDPIYFKKEDRPLKFLSYKNFIVTLLKNRVEFYKENKELKKYELWNTINVGNEFGVFGDYTELIQVNGDFIILSNSSVNKKFFKFLLITKEESNEIIGNNENNNKIANDFKLEDFQNKTNDELISIIHDLMSKLKSQEEKIKMLEGNSNSIIKEIGKENMCSMKSKILIGDISKLKFVKRQIDKIKNSNIKLKLIYSSYKDNIAKQDFHEAITGIKDTVCLYLTEKDRIFGGYTSKTWDDEENVKTDDSAFVFMILEDKNKIYHIKKGKEAIISNPNCGPTFFSIIETAAKLFEEEGSTCAIEDSNYDGMEIDYEINGGEEKFNLKAFECFIVEEE